MRSHTDPGVDVCNRWLLRFSALSHAVSRHDLPICSCRIVDLHSCVSRTVRRRRERSQPDAAPSPFCDGHRATSRMTRAHRRDDARRDATSGRSRRNAELA
jgi:hypothetical protein